MSVEDEGYDAVAIETDRVEWTRAMLETFIGEMEWLLARIERGGTDLDYARIRRLLRRQLCRKRRMLEDLEAGAFDPADLAEASRG